jgi:threonylcarbamoyladenosine tRNA methylthiotransferase CDKAL1
MKVFIKTFGCSTNVSDSEAMAGLLTQAGYELCRKENEAGLVIINSCTVKDATERNFFRYLNSLPKKPAKSAKHASSASSLTMPVIIAGCIPESNPESVKGYSLISPAQIDRIVEAAQKTISGEKVYFLGIDKSQAAARLSLPKIRKNNAVEILPISAGCLGECSYCITRFARGGLVSFPPEEIIRQAKSAVSDGAKEIWITSQDTGAYGEDIGTDIAELLEALLAIEGDFMVRLGMANPEHAKKHTKKLINIYKHEKMFKFIHIPVQSGSNAVLGRMGRKYSAENFELVATEFQKQIPNLTIATDVICGFPGETEKEFNETIALIKSVRPDVINISRYSARPGTKAAAMKQLPSAVISERTSRMSELFKKIGLQKNNDWLGWQGDAIVEGHGKNNTFVCRNFAYKPIIAGGSHKLGDQIKVRVKSATSTYLVA